MKKIAYLLMTTALPITSPIFANEGLDPSRAANTKFVFAERPTGISVSVAYGLSLFRSHHEILAQKASGQVQLDSHFRLVAADFSVAVKDLETGVPLRNCHMKQSLTMDYSLSGRTKDSQYPNEDKCGEGDAPEIVVPQAVQFRDVRFQFNKNRPENRNVANTPFLSGQWVKTDLVMDISIHGITRIIKIPMTIQVLNNHHVRIQSRFLLDIQDFGVKVKSFIGLDVENLVEIGIDSVLTPPQK